MAGVKDRFGDLGGGLLLTNGSDLGRLYGKGVESARWLEAKGAAISLCWRRIFIWRIRARVWDQLARMSFRLDVGGAWYLPDGSSRKERLPCLE